MKDLLNLLIKECIEKNSNCGGSTQKRHKCHSMLKNGKNLADLN